LLSINYANEPPDASRKYSNPNYGLNLAGPWGLFLKVIIRISDSQTEILVPAFKEGMRLMRLAEAVRISTRSRKWKTNPGARIGIADFKKQ